jgi:hypothetical protein
VISFLCIRILVYLKRTKLHATHNTAHIIETRGAARTVLGPDPGARLHDNSGFPYMALWVAVPSIQRHVLGTLKTGLGSLSASSDLLVLP